MKIGPYEVVRELGRGGMGVVHEARSPEGTAVAIKLLSQGSDAHVLLAFEREKRLLATLSEAEGFVPVRDAGTLDGRPWLVLPLMEGGSLRARLDKGPLPVEEALELVRKLARSIGTAHERGIVHRDLKPENVLFTKAGVPLIADLGLARHFRRDVLGGSTSQALSNTGFIAGTVGYMAPEQLDDSSRVGPRTDVFALGVVLHECIAGVRPFRGDGILTYASGLATRPRPLRDLAPSVPAWLDAAVARAIETAPGKRFADGRTFERALRDRASWRRPRRALPVAAFAVLLACGGGAAVLLSRVSPPPARRDGHMPPAAPGPPPPPRRPETPELSAAQLTERAEAEMSRADRDGAIADFTRAIELDPRLARAWAERGAARGQKGDLDEAIADLSKAINLEPGLAMAWGGRGYARGLSGDPDGEIADETRAIELDPGLAHAWVNRGSARARKGDWDGAIADLTRAIGLDPGIVDAWEERAVARGQRGDWDGAIADLTKAIELDPGGVGGWADRGRARGRKGDLDGAIADLEHCLEIITPGDSHIPAIRQELETLTLRRKR